jgi:phage-related protein
MRFEIRYYHPSVFKAIEAWPNDLYASFIRLYGLLEEHGPELGMPHSKAMGEGLFELRPKGGATNGRGFYCYLKGRRIVIVHAIIKKTQQTPDKELKLARKRVKEVQSD